MEDCCVVCAEPLEWVGYGVCGHRDVCSTCISRLRFVLNDKKCCICKQECSIVFVTKALGDFTKVVKDFTSLSEQTNIWYESSTDSYFDDKSHFEVIKAMCHLSCQICEQSEVSGTHKTFVKKGHVFRSLDQLHHHLLSVHKVQMCSLCLKGRKIFISEQKLYNNAQLARHLARGDSEVDGVGEERGGFAGHPMCEFCQVRYYGDNEIYQHMSVDHFNCHICQRLHPGQYAYFHNYDDLEAHFRHEHALCEHPDCLAKKFIVFTSDADLKRHNALTHGGNMSRSQRNAALQIPVSFQYRRPIRGRESAVNSSLYLGSQSSANLHDNSVSQPTSEFVSLQNGTSLGNRRTEPFAQISESSSLSGAAHHLGSSATTGLEESAFPPLPGSKNARRKGKQQMQGSTVSMASVLGGRNSRISTSKNTSGRMTGSARNNVSGNQWPRKVSNEQVVTTRRSADTMITRSSVSATAEKVNIYSVETSSSRNQLQDNGIPCVSDEAQIQNGVAVQINDEVRIANKALIDHIQSRFGNDKDLFTMFKDLSKKFKKGEIDACVYYNYTTSFGLEDFVPELARLCPDSVKQRNLLEAFQEGQKCKQSERAKQDAATMRVLEQASKESPTNTSGTHRLTDRGGTNATNLELISKDGCFDRKGKNRAELRSMPWSNVASSSGSHSNKMPMKDMGLGNFPLLVNRSIKDSEAWSCDICTLINNGLDGVCAACGIIRTVAVSEVTGSNCTDSLSSEVVCEPEVHGKRKKRASKFERARLGDDLLALSLNSKQSGITIDGPGPSTSTQRVSGRGAWRNGGGQKLLALAQKEAVIESAWKKE